MTSVQVLIIVTQTNAMMISTQHLLPTAPMHAIIPAELPLSFPGSGAQTPGIAANTTQPSDQGGMYSRLFSGYFNV